MGDEKKMDFSLEYHRGFLCVLVDKRARIVTAAGPVRIRKWFPIREAEQEEVVGLVGRPLTLVDEREGLYVDEDAGGVPPSAWSRDRGDGCGDCQGEER